jgi:hypothetical protein
MDGVYKVTDPSLTSFFILYQLQDSILNCVAARCVFAGFNLFIHPLDYVIPNCDLDSDFRHWCYRLIHFIACLAYWFYEFCLLITIQDAYFCLCPLVHNHTHKTRREKGYLPHR